MKKSKKLLIVSTALLLFSVLSVSLTLAYLTDSQEVKNRAEMTHVAVSVVDGASDIWDGSGPNVISVSSGDVSASASIYAWTDTKPRVVNTGTEPCYVRVTIAVGSDQVLEPGRSLNEYIMFPVVNSQLWKPETGQPSLNASSRVVLYYSKILQPGETSEMVFAGMQTAFGGADSSDFLKAFKDLNIVLIAEGAQTTKDGVPYNSAAAAFADLF